MQHQAPVGKEHSMWYDSIVSLQGDEISVYERDVCKQVVEGDGRQVHEEEHREQALYENEVVPLPV